MINQFFENFDAITDYYNFLIAKTKNLEYVGITNEWLIDNYYLLVEHKNNIVREKKQLAKQVKHSLYMNNAIKKIISIYISVWFESFKTNHILNKNVINT